jgi:hypothetical protein
MVESQCVVLQVRKKGGPWGVYVSTYVDTPARKRLS